VKAKTRFLCLCEGGNSRSVGLAFILKHYCDADAIAAGWRFMSSEALDMLYEWADRIVVMQPYISEKVPEKYADKVSVCDVGEDRYFRPDSKLINLCGTWAEREGLLSSQRTQIAPVHERTVKAIEDEAGWP
jgi:predicted protein tyrosine phosphatase